VVIGIELTTNRVNHFYKIACISVASCSFFGELSFGVYTLIPYIYSIFYIIYNATPV